MHLIVLPFVFDTIPALMWTLILKYDKPMEEMPNSWKYRIKIRRYQDSDGDDTDIFIKNSRNGSPTAGEPI
jgi:hypothetical protein